MGAKKTSHRNTHLQPGKLTNLSMYAKTKTNKKTPETDKQDAHQNTNETQKQCNNLPASNTHMHTPVISTVGVGVDCGIHIISDGPPELGVLTNGNSWPGFLGHIVTVSVEVPHDEDVCMHTPLTADVVNNLRECCQLLHSLPGAGVQCH